MFPHKQYIVKLCLTFTKHEPSTSFLTTANET